MKDRIKNKLKPLSIKLDYFLWKNTPKGKENNQKLKNLQGKYTGKRCFVMGNGPSLLKNDLTLLKNEITISSNAQYLIWDKMGFTPSFLTVEDPLVAEDRRDELNQITNVVKIFPKDLSHFLKLDDSTFYINFLRSYKGFPKFSDDFINKVYWGGTVSYMNLQLANYLGCSEIYLIGFDHSYKVPDKMDGHVITSASDDVNHIHPNYFGKGYRWHDPNVERMEVGYIQARGFFETKGVKIYNATVGGKLEVFERVDYNTLF